MRNPTRFAEAVEELAALYAERCLEAACRIVNAGMDDAGVARCSLLARTRMALEYERLHASHRQRPAHGEADDTAADHRSFDRIHGDRSCTRSRGHHKLL